MERALGTQKAGSHRAAKPSAPFEISTEYTPRLRSGSGEPPARPVTREQGSPSFGENGGGSLVEPADSEPLVTLLSRTHRCAVGPDLYLRDPHARLGTRIFLG